VDDPRSARQRLASVLRISPFGLVAQSELRWLMEPLPCEGDGVQVFTATGVFSRYSKG
jgi:hypothetical protein